MDENRKSDSSHSTLQLHQPVRGSGKEKGRHKGRVMAWSLSEESERKLTAIYLSGAYSQSTAPSMAHDSQRLDCVSGKA